MTIHKISLGILYCFFNANFYFQKIQLPLLMRFKDDQAFLLLIYSSSAGKNTDMS